MLGCLALLMGCPPDPEDPIVDSGNNILAPDLGGPDADAGPDAPDRPRDMGPQDMRMPDVDRPDADRPDGAQRDAERPDMGTAPDPEAEPSDPTAQATATVADPATATSVTVVGTNLDTEARLMRLGLVTYTGGRRQSSEQAAVRVDPGQSAIATFDLRPLGIITSALELPAVLAPRVVVENPDGSLHERIYGELFEVGPTLTDGWNRVLTANSLLPADIPTGGFGTFTSKLAGADKGSVGLENGDLLGPGEDGGPPLPGPNYDEGVPDANGMYHHTICLRWPTYWVDAGFGEDYGVEPEAAWRARGSRVQILANGDLIFDDWLDSNGCTPVIDSPHKTNFFIVAYSVAQAAGNTVVVKDFNGDVDSYVRVVDNVGGSGVKHYTLPQTNRSNLLAASTFTLERWGTLSGETFELNDRCDPNGNQCCDCANGDGIWISRRTRKFIISHEVGHRLLSLYTGGYTNDCTKVIQGMNIPCTQADPTSHALTSNEWSSCAAMEGWAHFVAVRAYNDHLEGNEPGATFQYWSGTGLTVDVEQGPVGGVDRFYESMCGGTGATAGGSGVELDWLRHWWDYHTDPAPEGPVSAQLMMQEIAENSNWMSSTAYQVMSDGIEAFSGAAQRARWESIAAANGVDH